MSLPAGPKKFPQQVSELLGHLSPERLLVGDSRSMAGANHFEDVLVTTDGRSWEAFVDAERRWAPSEQDAWWPEKGAAEVSNLYPDAPFSIDVPPKPTLTRCGLRSPRSITGPSQEGRRSEHS